MKIGEANIISEMSSLDRRASSLSIAKRLVRKRYMQTAIDAADRCQMDGTNVVYRNQGIPYVNCAFLDDGDTIIAANEQGYIDIVRVPRYDGTGTRPLGRALCTNLSLCLDRSHKIPNCRKIYGFQSGQAFAVGLNDGEFQIFSTERTTTPSWVSLGPQLGLEKTHTTPIQDYITFAYKVRAPRRKCDIQRESPLTLSEQRLNPRLDFYIPSDVREICRHPDPWDFREISSGSLQAVNVGWTDNNVSFRVLDSRTPSSLHDICIDLQMEKLDCIGAICFINDHAVATVYSTRFNHPSYPTKTTGDQIKIWDLRYIQKEKKYYDLAAFPYNNVHGFDEMNCIPMSVDYSCYQTSPKNLEFLLSHLTPLPNGRLMASCASHPCHFVIDPVQMTTVSMVHTRDQYDLFAIDRQNGFIATHGSNGRDDTGSSLYFFDSEKPNNVTKAGKKRKNDDTSNSDKSDHGHNYDFKFDADVQDRNGLPTTLSHMSFNNLGSSLIATSFDGDIFLWRAS